MKQKFKQIIALFAISSLIILSGCTQEKDFVNEHNHPNIDFKEKSFKEALSLPLFNDALKKVAKQKGAFKSEDAARTALEDQYGFTIVADSPVRIITDENGTVFYTILIERDVKEELIFENLMIKVEDEETTAAIFKYTLTEKGEISEDGDYPIKGISNTVFTDLNVENKMFFNANGETCFETFIFKCDDQLGYTHDAFGACFQNGTAYAVVGSVCMGDNPNPDTIGIGGGGATSGSSNNTGGLGSSGGNNTTVSLSPITCKTGNCIEADVPVDPCEIFGEIINPLKINLEGFLPSLLNSAQNRDNGEVGYSFQRKIASNGTVSFPPKIYKDGGTGEVSLDVGLDIFGGIHIHPNSLESMFSFADILYLLKFYNAASEENKKRITFMLVASDGNVYAMHLYDITKFFQFIQSKYYTPYMGLILTPSERLLKTNNACNKFLKKDGVTPVNLQKNFAKYIKNSGINFFKLEGYPRVWKKIESINDGDSAPLETPCN